MVELLKVIPAFALTSLLLAVVPGQGVAMVLRQSIVGGARAAFTSVAGNSTGLVIWGAASAIGLSQVFARSQTAYNVLKYAGVVFLIFLSVRTLWTLRNEYGEFDYNGLARTGKGPAFRLGLLTNLTNVKAAVFAVAFIPAFVPKEFSLDGGIFILACVQALVSTCWYIFLIAIVDRSSVYLAKPKVRRSLTAFSAAGILFLAISLLLASPR
ncbi:MAG: LysE family translocator [Actinobacteria bacterium]|nr:LysE family translocator [Actinomycetota bacterium]